MKRVVQLRLLPDDEQAHRLARTLEACNAAACEVSAAARTYREYHKYGLRRHTYHQIRARYGLGSQVAQAVIAKVADAYTTHRANLTAGRYGKVGTVRRTKAASRVLTFRPRSAQAFDQRNLSWDHQSSTASVWTTQGRTIVSYTARASDLALLRKHTIGESDLTYRDGKWYLMVTLTLPDVPPATPDGFIGVDLGLVLIASTEHVNSDGAHVPGYGTDWSGGAVTRRRKTNRRIRQRLQTKGTPSAKRLLKKRARKEARYAADINHQISKRIVTEAQRTGRGIAVENLTGIRERVRLRKPQRVTLHTWSFAQLGGFLAYKAEAAGVVLLQVDPRYTSQECSTCANVDKKARTNQAIYVCTNPQCGVSLNADHNAAINIARRGLDGWGAVNRPNAAAA